ncbi:MAG: alcohol dehydrogenase catalytic domain-containing protein [Spirochaetes bacterium]|nr:alcohol dehydrogenase catalytic domain-containing protein [Spirochaetota bacterium]
MKAAMWRGPFELSVEDVPVPKPCKGEVLIKTMVVGVCGSDLEVYEGKFKHARPPMILGHEGGGIIEELGTGVTGISRGSRVVVECVLHCGTCEFCRKKRYGLCESGKTIGLIGADGEYAEYFVAPAENCYPLPEQIDWSEAAMTDTLAGPQHGLKGVEINQGDTAAVFGAGPAGLLFCALLKERGTSSVYIVDIQEHRLQLGPQFGADLTIHAQREESVQIIRDSTGGRGVDVVVEAAGSQKALGEGMQVLRKGGYLLLYGVFGGPVNVDLQPIQFCEYTVVGSCGLDYPAALEFIGRRTVPVERMVTHRFELGGLVDAFESGMIREQRDGYIKGVVFL